MEEYCTYDADGDYLVSAWQNHVYPPAARPKMNLKRPPVQPCSRPAREAAEWAEKQGRFGEYTIALFRVFVQEYSH